MRFLVLAGALLGVALMAALGWRFGGAALEEALKIGLVPIAWAAAYHVISLALYAWSWRLLIAPEGRPRFATLLRLRWIGESVNTLLPAAQIGGDLTRTRLLAARGVGGPVSAAAMIADIGIGTFTQALFSFAGLAALNAAGAGGRRTWSIVLAAALPLAGGLGALMLLPVGPGRQLARWLRVGRLGKLGKTLASGFVAIDHAMRAIARRPGALVRAAIWHLLGWLSQVGETWGVLALCGVRISWTAALAIESLTATARAVAFFVPGGLGVQDGALIYLCTRLGVPLEPALALGLVKRLRELVVGLPGLASWGFAERVPLARLRARVRARLSESCGDA